MKDQKTKTQQCKNEGCGKTLPLSEFYPIRAKGESKARYEKICKSCKKKRRQGVQIASLKEKMRSERPKRSIEPGKTCNSSDLLLSDMCKGDVNQADFSLWEGLYGKELDNTEKLEIQTNLMALVTVLAEERYRQTGQYIELSKDK